MKAKISVPLCSTSKWKEWVNANACLRLVKKEKKASNTEIVSLSCKWCNYGYYYIILESYDRWKATKNRRPFAFQTTRRQRGWLFCSCAIFMSKKRGIQGAMEEWQINSSVMGFHEYKNVWTPEIGQMLQCEMQSETSRQICSSCETEWCRCRPLDQSGRFARGHPTRPNFTRPNPTRPKSH